MRSQTGSHRTARLAVLLLAAALAQGCSLARWGQQVASSPPQLSPAKMSEPEARLALLAARQHLYGDATPDSGLAVQLANSVIKTCTDKDAVWDAFVVKSEAYAVGGNAAEAAATAKKGIETLLAEAPAERGPTSLTALRILLTTYVESAAPSEGADKPLANLALWRKELSARLAAAPPAVAAQAREVDAAFAPLEEMARQHVAARAPERAVERAVKQYLAAFNAKDKAALLAMLAPGSELADAAKRSAFAAVVAEPVDNLFLVSALKTTLPTASSAVAICDVLWTSRAGWGQIAHDVTFSLKKADSGTWLIWKISGHP